jgi:shikimate dehydrogenase
VSERVFQRVGLLGWPVEHSVSPAMHNAAFDALGLAWHYELLPTSPDQVEASLQRLKVQDYQGANVTVPHKQAVMPYLDQLADDARAIGAVNTLLLQEGSLVGHNTDAAGFLAALREAGFEPAGQRALVLGAGGAARAVTYALAAAGCTTTLFGRTAERAAVLARCLGQLGLPSLVNAVPGSATLADLRPGAFDLLVNATPVGMWPHVDASPWPAALSLSSHWTVFDLVYNPEETRLLAQARAAGATPIGGLGMLVHQGARAFELWTGRRAPVEIMRAAARQALTAQASKAGFPASGGELC